MPEPSTFFFLGLCLILVHELDAVRLQEWRLFPLLSKLSDELAYRVFTVVHVPLFALLIWGLFQGPNGGLNQTLIGWLDAFFVVHLFLHVLLRNHPHNRFTTWFSWVFIGGAGVCGALDTLLGRW